MQQTEETLKKLQHEARKIKKQQKLLKAVSDRGLDERAIRWCLGQSVCPYNTDVITYRRGRGSGFAASTEAILQAWAIIDENREIFERFRI